MSRHHKSGASYCSFGCKVLSVFTYSCGKVHDIFNRYNASSYYTLARKYSCQRQGLAPRKPLMCKDGKTVVSQKQQLRVMRSFREGGCNVLVATCVAEEGMDVGSVDLIVCFDISTRSPIRLVQRCGRTGRERGGQVFILVTEGREHQKKKKGTEFLEMEAELSNDEDHSGDELSDDSVGSIVDFICDDDNVTHHKDMHAIYLKSIKSPVRVKGGFKIPELPKKYCKEEVLSQFVEEDSYEMDSFCVDSHIGLTQANDVSELELAEMLLEEKRRAKKKGILSPDESPEIKRKHKPKRIQIDSDSDDSL